MLLRIFILSTVRTSGYVSASERDDTLRYPQAFLSIQGAMNAAVNHSGEQLLWETGKDGMLTADGGDWIYGVRVGVLKD